MRVAMYYNNNDIRIEEMPIPKIDDNEILIRVKAAGICGTDVLEWYRIDKAPLVLGHEIAGEIVEVGNKVKNYKIGDRVTASHHVPCNTCYYCLRGHHTVCETLRRTNFIPGGFSEYVKLPSINVDRGVYIIPDEVSFEEATFTEPLACVVRAQKHINIQPGDTILVVGCGVAGLLHIQLARILGACRIIAVDINDYRLNAAIKFGADIAINSKEYSKNIRSVNNGYLADIVIVATGAKIAIEEALKSVERGGTILFFAPTDKDVTIPISINDLFWRDDRILTSSYAGDRADHITALELIRAKRINVVDMITHVLPLEKIQLGFQLVAKAQDSLKVIIKL
jgi:L-iditol 2-dehydrogenase